MINSSPSVSDSLPYMNVCYFVPSFDLNSWFDHKASIKTRDSMVKELSVRNSPADLPEPQVLMKLYQKSNSLAQTYIERFKKNFKEKKDKLLSQPYCFKPTEYLFDLKTVLLDSIQRQVKFYLANSPKDSKVIENWNKFRQEFSQISQNDNSKLTRPLNRFLNELKDKIFSSTPRADARKLLNSVQSEWNIIHDLLSFDPDLLETPIVALTGLADLSAEAALKISVEHLLTANNHLIDQCLQDIPWVLDCVEAKLKPFASLPQHEIMNFSQSLLEMISTFRNDFFSKISKLYLNNYNDCSNRNLTFLANLQEKLREWSTGGTAILKKDIEIRDGISFITFSNFSVFKSAFNQASQVLTSLINIKKELTDLHNKKVAGELSPKEERSYLCYNQQNIKNIDDYIHFHQVHNECSELISF